MYCHFSFMKKNNWCKYHFYLLILKREIGFFDSVAVSGCNLYWMFQHCHQIVFSTVGKWHLLQEIFLLDECGSRNGRTFLKKALHLVVFAHIGRSCSNHLQTVMLWKYRIVYQQMVTILPD